MTSEQQQTNSGGERTALLRRTFPHLIGLLQLIPRPRWAAPALVSLGIFASLAEAVGIMLIPLFFYSMMDRLNFLAEDGGPLGIVLRYALRRFHNSREIALFFLLLIVLRGILAYAYGLATAYISERISQNTRDRVHNQYLRLPYSFLQQHEQGELMETLGREAWLPSAAYTSLTRILVNGTFIATLGALLAVLSWRITLCVFVGSLLLSAVLHRLSSRANSIGLEMSRVHQNLWDRMMIALQGMRTIRAFGQEDQYRQQFDAASTRARDVAIRSEQLSLLLDPLTEVGYLIILGIIMVAAPHLGASFATTLTCVALLYRLQPHVREVEGHRLKLLQLEPQLQSVRSILEAERMHIKAPGNATIQSIQRGIRFDRVTFKYQSSNQPALNEVSFEIPRGATTALVGASGSGKTTVVNLLLRLYRPDCGTIYVDDTPLDDLKRTDWLKMIAVAGQEVDLVDGTVEENIKMADSHASGEAIAAAARMVGLAEVLESLPDGYNTWIGHQGLRFSGGERQRIGLARAALHGPTFLILDEAMSAMDPALEHRVRKAINHRFTGCTILLIAHRLETVLNADHVIYMNGGQIVAEGKPSDMLLDNDSPLSKALATSR